MDAFVNKWNGKQVTAFGGECVALVAQYLVENGKPIAYANAKDWWGHPAISGSYDFITNNPNDYNQVPQRGDVIVWNGGLAGSGGYGHIAIFDRVVSPGVFTSFDQNWGGRQAHFVSHNWNNVIGWFRPKQAQQPQGGNEVFQNDQEVKEAYLLLRGNEGTPAERAGWIGQSKQRFFQVARAEADSVRASLANMQNSINQLNQTVTQINTESSVTKAQLQEAIAKVSGLTSELENAHDQIAELQNKPAEEVIVEKNPSWLQTAIDFINKVLGKK